jgi:cell division protein FtsB
LVGIFLLIYLPGFNKIQKLKARSRDLEKKIRELKAANAGLKREEKLLQEDPFYQEKVAREELGLTKKGEVVFEVNP